MPDDSPTSDEGSSGSGDGGTGSAMPPPRRSFLRRHWLKVGVTMAVLVPTAVFVIWASVTLGFSYSSGERVGYVQKLSRKGWLCKTWEGELQMIALPGTIPSIFQFSVRDDNVARRIESAAGKQVALRYEEHRGVPSRCFGETPYYVTGIRELGQR